MRFLSRIVAGSLLAVLLVFSLVDLVEAEQSRQRASERLRLLEQTERTLSDENARLRSYTLQNRKSYLCYLARNELGLVESDEYVFVIRNTLKDFITEKG